jgi:hypothetical protein
MDTPGEILKWAVIVLVAAVFFRRRFGPVWPRVRQRLGPRWPLFIKIASVATLAIWILLWALASPERREESRQYYQETAPWVVR